MYVGTDAVEALYVGSDPVLRAFLGEEAVYVPSLVDLDFVLAYWDPSDITTLFQDSAGTIPVEAALDPVGLMWDKTGNNIHFSTPDASRPLWDGVNALIFDGSSAFMTYEGQPFPSGANPAEIWSIVRQDALPADTTQRQAIGYGGSLSTAIRRLQRFVDTGVNRIRATVGDGAVSVAVPITDIDCSGVHRLRASFGATQTVMYADGSTAQASAIPSTGTVRVRLGAGQAAAAANFWHGKVGPSVIANPDTEVEVAILRKYLDSITVT